MPGQDRPRIGRYELCSEIASGGMGRVYLATARGPAGFEKLVALKTIHPEMAKDPAFLDMFFDEARIAARIAHANVCGVFDFGEADGRYFIAMEYLVGETVGKLLRGLAKQSTRAQDHDVLAARIVADAAEGLHAAHELRDEHGQLLEVVHRDVSPQNVFVGYDGGVRVVDFGIATARGRLHETSTGSLKGKFAYMSPEQMRREKLDRRADVWALGVVLWELLTRARLYRADDEVGLMLAVLNDPVRKPSDARSIDPALEQIVLKALEKDRDARWASARELSSALSRWVVARGEVVGQAEVATLMERTFPEERRAAMSLVERVRSGKSDGALDLSLVQSSAPTDPLTSPAVTVDVPTTPHRTARRRRPLVWVGLAAVAVLASGAVLVGTFGGGSGDAASPVAAGATHDVAPTRAVPTAPPRIAPTDTTAPPTPTDTTVPPTPTDTTVPPTPTDTTAPPTPNDTTAPPHHATHVAPASATGTLHVETPGGWAYVYLDGRRLGRTPLDTELPSGASVVELRPFGLAPLRGGAIRRTVRIGARPARLVVPIEP